MKDLCKQLFIAIIISILTLFFISAQGCVRVNSPSYMSANASASIGSKGPTGANAPDYMFQPTPTPLPTRKEVEVRSDPEQRHGLTNPFKRRDAE